MRKTLFQYAVLKHPKTGDADTEAIIPPSAWILAADSDEVVFHAIRAIPEEHAKDHTRLEVLVRPFCGQ